MYRPTFAVDAIGVDGPVAIEIAIENMGHLLDALVAINRNYLRRFPKRIPPVYESGVRYDRMEPPPGSVCGDDDWQDAIVSLEKGLADCEDLAAWRCAELIERYGIDARPFVSLRREPGRGERTRHLYHIMVQWPARLPAGTRYPETVFRDRESGLLLEDPSRVLGMK